MFVNEREVSCKSDVKEEKKGLMISTSDDELLLLKKWLNALITRQYHNNFRFKGKTIKSI